MGDAGEGLIDAEARIQERMEELERDRQQNRGPVVREPELVRELESLRLARLELERQLAATTHERRRAQIAQATTEIDRRMTELSARHRLARDPRCDSVHRYHDGTKHHFDRFARSLGYLDWASQPKPFRSFAGAPAIALPFSSSAAPVAYDRLYRPGAVPPAPIALDLVGDLLRHALGALRVEALRRLPLVAARQSVERQPPPHRGVSRRRPDGRPAAIGPRVYHYAPDRHALERRATFDPAAWRAALGDPAGACLVGLTSIHWREAWKYGERAFRYCQHDIGHAIAAVRLAAALVGWRASIAVRLARARRRDAASVSTATPTSSDAEREERGLRAAPVVRSAVGRGAGLARRSSTPSAGRVDRPRQPVERGSRRVDVHRRDRPRHRGSRPRRGGRRSRRSAPP